MQYRKTQQRERILELLRGTRSHPTADWVYSHLKEEIPGLSLGTVYRNLKVLMAQGQIQKLPNGSTFDRYDATVAPHYHLVCERCGVVEDLEMAAFSDLNQRAQKLSAFKVTRHRIDFFGLCQKCQKASNKQPKRKDT